MAQIIKNIIIASVLLPVIISIESRAEVIMFQNLMRDYAITNIQNHALYSPNTSNNRDISPSDGSTNPKVGAAINKIKLKYSPSLAQRKINFARFINDTRSNNPSKVKELELILSSTDVIVKINEALMPLGFQSNNIADAYAAYWCSAWLASAGSDATPSRSQFLKVKNQAAAALATLPEIFGASDNKKQELAEALLIQAALIDASMEQAAGNRDQIREVGNAVRKGAEAMNLDLYGMKLTDEGFVPIKRGSAIQEGAIPSLPGDDSNQRVATSTIPAESTPNYALIAAAGGAGLGGMFLLGKVMGRKN